MEHYDFDKVGRKMPYRVPDTFFDDMERRIMAKAVASPRRRRNLLPALRRSARVAGAVAAVALLLVAVERVTPEAVACSTEIDIAFDSLSDADRSSLLEIYQDDIFMNQ
ncbi:MAG: hypothetical protein K2I25_02130 [Muribaculaceae bacterium]|nr:hypothetical protein [Muribaculaceae bacterium]